MGKSKLSENPVVVTLAGLKALLALNQLAICISSGNDKTGDIPYLSMPAGSEPLKRSDGVILRDFGGTCKGCDKKCGPDCYAKSIEIYRDQARAAYARNYVLAKYAPAEFEKQLCAWLERSNIRYFRIHESGEFFSWDYLNLICRVCAKFPDIHFYTYTKRYYWTRKALDLGIIPENLKINISADRENYNTLKKQFPELTCFVWDDCNLKYSELEPLSCDHCKAVLFNGKKSGVTCIECKACIIGNNDIAVYDHSTRAHKKI